MRHLRAACIRVAAALCRLQAECEALKTRGEGIQEELQLSRSTAEQLRRDREAAEAALSDGREEAESLRTDLGRTNFRLGDMQEMLHRLQVEPVLGSPCDRTGQCELPAAHYEAHCSGQMHKVKGSQGVCAVCRLPWTRRQLPGWRLRTAQQQSGRSWRACWGG